MHKAIVGMKAFKSCSFSKGEESVFVLLCLILEKKVGLETSSLELLI